MIIYSQRHTYFKTICISSQAGKKKNIPVLCKLWFQVMIFWAKELDDLWTLCDTGVTLEQLGAVFLQSFDAVHTLTRPLPLKVPLHACSGKNHDDTSVVSWIRTSHTKSGYGVPSLYSLHYLNMDSILHLWIWGEFYPLCEKDLPLDVSFSTVSVRRHSQVLEKDLKFGGCLSGDVFQLTWSFLKSLKDL